MQSNIIIMKIYVNPYKENMDIRDHPYRSDTDAFPLKPAFAWL
jgi:hypothetical protein